MTHHELRKKFFEYFKSKNHEIVESSSLIPIDDPALLFTTAGMLQFKPLYAGIKKASYSRAVTVQKCFRLSDLENIGKTARHHTFFEMFGNFCFGGDYFKKEAIEFAWEFSVDIIKLDKEKIYISVYEDDDDAYEIWNKHIGIPKEKIVRLGKADNFWGPAGASGACGPCSELYIDMGEEKGCKKPNCFVGCDCERYLEFWNLVFNEFFQDTDGTRTPLANVGIDTGMGLERLAYITQGVESNYQTDVMKPIVDSILKKLNVKYTETTKTKINVIADHLRALVFVMSEGVIPSNEGRGYVLRRLLRRALKAAGDLEFRQSFLSEITYSVVDTYKEIYPYLIEKEAGIKTILLTEEEKFYQTISVGMNKLYSIMDESKNKTITGEQAFTLFDTYGLPFEITEEEAKDQGFTVDSDGFKNAMNEQRQRSRGKSVDKKSFDYIEKCDVQYVGENYENISNGIKSSITALYQNDKKVSSLKGVGIIITKATPFYGEMGGQVGDTGIIKTENSKNIKVVDTQKKDGVTIHIVDTADTEISLEDNVELFIDLDRRNSIRKNHTGTHVLQRVLELKLGTHVSQAGSLVTENHLRFDFTHNKSITDDELLEIENEVNNVVFKSYPAIIKSMSKDDAIDAGAKALFGEKYDNTVRTLNIGNGFSFELCGGSHITNTSEIGYFHILSEGSISSGVRRIEATTGINAAKTASNILSEIKTLSKSIGVNKVNDIQLKMDKLTEDIKKLQKENKTLKMGGKSNNDFLASYKTINDIKYYSLHFDEDTKTTKEYTDVLKERVKEHIAIITSSFENTHSIMIQVAGTTKVSANSLLKDIIAVSGGRGGGKDSFAQGSIENIEKARSFIESIEKDKLLNILG